MNQALETITRTPAPVAVSDATLNLFQDSVALNTRRAYAAALRRLDAWLDGQQLTDAALADYLGQLDTQGRAPSSATRLLPLPGSDPDWPGNPRPQVHSPNAHSVDSTAKAAPNGAGASPPRSPMTTC